MNESRHAPASRPEIDHGVGNYRVAIVGAATLKGKELADVLSERNFPRRDVKLLDDDESLGQFCAGRPAGTFRECGFRFLCLR